MKFSAEEIEQYQTLGYVKGPRVFSDGQLAALHERIDAILAGAVDFPPHLMGEAVKKSGAKGQLPAVKIVNLFRHDPVFAAAIKNAAISALAHQLMTGPVRLWEDQMIYKPPRTHAPLLWHQDAAYGWKDEARERSCTAWLSLATATREMGSLQFIPGSHRHGVVEHANANHKTPVGGLEAAVDASLAEVVEYAAGDATFHHGCTLHYTSSNTTDTPRRGLSIHIMPASVS